jgi:hypothetical protein
MVTLNYPEPDFRLREEGGRRQVFDRFRRKWVALTPEEWVRQNIVRWLTVTLAYPAAMISLERELNLGELRKRFDVLIFDREHKPWMLVECKAPEITLGDAVLKQILTYNLSVPVPFMVVTNGQECHVARKGSGTLEWLDEMPVYPL